MKALVLAAGYATRLYPLTKKYPKPLLKVGPKCIIDYAIEKLDSLDEIDEIIVITNTKFVRRFREWSAKAKTNKKISLVDDLSKTLSDRRGAIGDMSFAINKKRIKDDLLVIGGDNLFDGGLRGFVKFAKASKGSPVLGVYRLKSKKEGKKYGIVALDKSKRVIDFQEKPQNPKSKLAAMCLYYFPRQRVKLIKSYLSSKSSKTDATGFYIDWLRKKIKVYGFVFKGRWYDIGDLKFLNEAKRKFSN
ncbi:MAG: nucleotidyltransferase family protein [Candidatus Omnitrophica bacterium]|nr:nucleotidyltransferase family protein [Candidatus Omnitrophota bacterium]